MPKYIYEYNITAPKIAYSNQMTIVYENKTYYYCKVNGTGQLYSVPKNQVDTGGRFFTSTKQEYAEIIQGQERRRLETKAKHLAQVVQSYTISKEQALKELLSVQASLDTLSTHLTNQMYKFNRKD